MIIPTQLLRETEERYRERQEPREEWRQEIAAGGVVGANAPEVGQRRLERLARVEATMGTPAGAFALERVIGKSDLIGVVYLELALAVSRSVSRVPDKDRHRPDGWLRDGVHGFPTAAAHQQPRP